MTRPSWILGALLVASLGLNLELWHRGPGSDRASGQAPRTPHAGVARRSGSGARPATAPRPAPGNSVRDQTCPAELRDLGQRLARVQEKLDRYLPPGERFEAGAPSPALESRMKRALASLLDGAPDGWSHDVECRADVCRLEVVERDGSDDFDWMSKIQQQRPDGVGGMVFEASRPGQDPVTKEPLTSQVAYLKVTAEARSGAAILAQVLERFRGGGGVARCQAAHPDADGYWSIRIDLRPDARDITVWEGGTLAATPAGSCLRAALDQVIDATELPDAFTGAVRFNTISLPAASPRLSGSRPSGQILTGGGLGRAGRGRRGARAR